MSLHTGQVDWLYTCKSIGYIIQDWNDVEVDRPDMSFALLMRNVALVSICCVSDLPSPLSPFGLAHILIFSGLCSAER